MSWISVPTKHTDAYHRHFTECILIAYNTFKVLVIEECHFTKFNLLNGPYKYWVFRCDKHPIVKNCFRLDLLESYSALYIDDEIIMKLKCPDYPGDIKC